MTIGGAERLMKELELGKSPCVEYATLFREFTVVCERELHHKGKHKAHLGSQHHKSGLVTISWKRDKRPKLRDLRD